MSFGTDTVPCGTCGQPTPMRGTKRCDGCWEVEHRMRDYLRNEGARAFVREELVQARLTLVQRVLLLSGDLTQRAAVCLTEIVETCRDLGFCLSHEDGEGSFILEPRTEERHGRTGQPMNEVNEEWLLSAQVAGLSPDEDRAARTERLEAARKAAGATK